MDYQTFIPPKEAPVFEPSAEEFEDPIAYIAKIRPIGEQTGIVKIRPPVHWKPPFSIDPEKLRFTPRVQTLNELEASTRVKLNFLDALARFWDLQGSSLKVPNVERIPLDLHLLFKTVVAEGGYDEVTALKKWSEIGRMLKFQMQSTPAQLKFHYEKVLYPYEVFLAKHEKIKVVAEKKRTPIIIPCQQASSTGSYSLRTSRRSRLESPDMVDFVPSTNELKKLKFLSPGPKNSSYGPVKLVTRHTIKVERFSSEGSTVDDPKNLSVNISPSSTQPLTQSLTLTSPLPLVKQESDENVFSEDQRKIEKWAKEMAHIESYTCRECGRGDMESELLICEGCDACYHIFCLDPPLRSIPTGDWKCPECVSKECSKPQESFGFEQAKREYTLTSFGDMANKFKQSYFHMPHQEVPTSLVEREFWRILGSTEEDVTVEYGADLHSSEKGSGFPTTSTTIEPDEQKYATSGWNLTNLANLPGSALSYVKANISGMKVPWLYVGMCFSSFCWHTEDHWIYSINYLHWGEPKTWYGVPPTYAEDLEHVMMESAPELFENQPDLIHHLVTIMSPNILMQHNIPVVRTDQCAGEFVVTFPRAYHAGFNQGYNFAEAVNFALPDWISLDRRSIEHYRKVKRTVVFSHEELLSGMAEVPDKLEVNILVASFQEMKKAVELEEERRQLICAKWKPIRSKEAINLLPDDERQCDICLTTVFWSACECPCLPGKLICIQCMLEHSNCEQGRQIFKYSYSMDELKCQLDQLGEYAEDYTVWRQKVQEVLSMKSSKPEYVVIRPLVKQGSRWIQSNCEQLCQLQLMLEDAEMCSTVASQIINIKCKTRYSGAEPTLSLEELKGFIEEVENLPCTIPEYHELKKRLQQVEEFQRLIVSELNQCRSAMNNMRMRSSLQAVRLLAKCSELNVQLPEMESLEKLVKQLQWLQKAEAALKPDGSSSTTNTLRFLSDLLKEGNEMADNKLMTETCNSLKHLIKIGKKWEQKAQEALEVDPPYPVSYLTTIIKGVSTFGLFLPGVEVLQKVVIDANSWTSKAKELELVEKPHYSAIEKLLAKKEPLQVELNLLSKTQQKYGLAVGWLQNANNMFVKISSEFSLLEVLLPRGRSSVIVTSRPSKKKRNSSSESPPKKLLAELHGNKELEKQRIDLMETEEWDFITELRAKNERKQNLQDESKILYCHCQQPSSGYMVQCDLCLDWYHDSCLVSESEKPDANAKYLCSCCKRSNRPGLTSATGLLTSLQSLPVSLTEGTALECLVTRALKWQKKAKEAISKTRMVFAQQQVVKKQQEVKAAIDKLQSMPELVPLLNKTQPKQGAVLSSKPLTQNHDTVAKSSSSVVPIAPKPPVPSCVTGTGGVTVGSLLQKNFPSITRSTGLSKSTSSVQAIVSALLAVNKNENNNSGGVNKKSELPSELRKELEEVMLRCDLLEVTFEESQQLWQILHEDEILKSSNIQSTNQLPESADTRKRKQLDNHNNSLSGDNHKKSKSLPDSSDWEECSATNCVRPADSTVNWVQCEECQRWFHIRCIDLTYREAKTMDVYKCSRCQTAEKAGVQIILSPQSLQAGTGMPSSVMTGGFRPLLSIPESH